jgi:hypothetical protein
MYALTVRVNMRRQQQTAEYQLRLPVSIAKADIEKLGLSPSLLNEMTAIAVSPRSPGSGNLATRRSRSSDGSIPHQAGYTSGFSRATLTGALQAAIRSTIPSLASAPSRLGSCPSSAASTPRHATSSTAAPTGIKISCNYAAVHSNELRSDQSIQSSFASVAADVGDVDYDSSSSSLAVLPRLHSSGTDTAQSDDRCSTPHTPVGTKAGLQVS